MSYLNLGSKFKNPRFGSAWTDAGGTINATVYLGDGYMAFDSASEARLTAAAIIEAAEAMERLAAEGVA